MIVLKINNIFNYINSLYFKCCNLDDTDFVKIEKDNKENINFLDYDNYYW